MELLTAISATVVVLSIPVLCALLIVPLFVLEILQWRIFASSPKNKAIFITGCDTGFGRLLAERLYHKGAKVYAACLTPTGCQTLEKLCPDKSRMRTVQLDITDQKSVDSARDFMSKELENDENGLWGLVNNAGIARGFFVEFTPIENFQQVMDVNFIGQVRITKALLPLIRRSKKGGRIINIASVAGRMAAPGMSAYAASKFAMEAWSDSLRREVMPLGIKVCIFEPWFCATEIVKSPELNIIPFFQQAPAEIQQAYGGEAWAEKAVKATALLPKFTESPNGVVNGISAALFSPWPRVRYSCTYFGELFAIPMSWFSGELQDLPYFFGRFLAPSPK